MPEKRKNKSGRILRTGECQRKDLIYQYRYTDVLGKRQAIYASPYRSYGRRKKLSKRKQMPADAGMDIKSLQYLMEHSDVGLHLMYIPI